MHHPHAISLPSIWMVTSGAASMQRASIFRELCTFPGLRAATDMAGPGVSAAVEHFSRPAASVRISTTPAIPRTPAGDPGRSAALRPAPNCPRQSQPGDNASRTANSAMVLAPKPEACYAARSIPPRPPCPVPSRNPDLAASHVIRPAGRRPPRKQRLVTRRIVGRDRMTHLDGTAGPAPSRRCRVHSGYERRIGQCACRGA